MRKLCNNVIGIKYAIDTCNFIGICVFKKAKIMISILYIQMNGFPHLGEVFSKCIHCKIIHIWSLLTSIHVKSLPTVKLGQFGFGSNIAQIHIWSLLDPIFHENLTKRQIRKSWNRLEHCSKSII